MRFKGRMELEHGLKQIDIAPLIDIVFQLLIFFMLHYWEGKHKGNYKYLLFSGLVAGFGIYFDYIFLITITAIFILSLLENKIFLESNGILPQRIFSRLQKT